MKLKYQTGIVAFIQFIAGSVLGFGNGLLSSITSCTNHGSDCVSNTLVSLVLIILTVLWFGFVAILGYAAQDRRSRRLARLLMLAEAAIALVALFDAKHFPNILSLMTSLLDCLLALWVLLLAFRLSRANGGRVVASGANRKRQRRHTV
jgi:preprotein translocase subunit SecG